MKFSFNKRYFLAFVALLVIEVLIAKFVTDSFIRPFVGDYLVMILIYLFFRACLKGALFPLRVGEYFNSTR